MFKLGSEIFSNVLIKEVSSAQQGCIYLSSKKYMPDSRRVSQITLIKIVLIKKRINVTLICALLV